MLSVAIPKLEGNIEERFGAVVSRVARYAPQVNRELLQRAFDFARIAHEGQFRKSGDPYIIHPLK